MRFFSALPMHDAPNKVIALLNTAIANMVNLETLSNDVYESIMYQLERSGELWYVSPQKDMSPIYFDLELYEDYLDDIIVALRGHSQVPSGSFRRFIRVVKKWWIFTVHVRIQGQYRLNREFYFDLMSVYFSGVWDGYVNGKAEEMAIRKGMLILDAGKINNITLKIFNEKQSLSQYMLQHLKSSNKESSPITNGIFVNIFELIQGDKIQSKAYYKDLITCAKEYSWNAKYKDLVKIQKLQGYLKFQNCKEMLNLFSFEGWHFHVMFMTEPGYSHVMILANKTLFQQSIHKTYDQAYEEASMLMCQEILIDTLSIEDIDILISSQFPHL